MTLTLSGYNNEYSSDKMETLLSLQNPLYADKKIVFMNWDKISTASIWIGFGFFLTHLIFGKYLANYFYVFIIPEILSVIIYLIAEIIKFRLKQISKKKVAVLMKKKLIIYSNLSITFLCLSLIAYIIIGLFFKQAPVEIVVNFILFSSGLFIGIQCCIDAIRKDQNKKSITGDVISERKDSGLN